jgi:glycerol-3-phosphate O-acyltransferase
MLSNGVPAKYQQVFEEVSAAYRAALAGGGTPAATADRLFGTFVGLVSEQLQSPYTFEPFHRKITTPFDYYTFGVDFFRPLVNKAASTLHGHDQLQRLTTKLAAGDNVIFLANHQTEADPQAISLMLEDDFASLAEDMTFVAGERVTTDPLTAPFSKGRNLLCIFSKRHIDHPPEQKAAKTHHNRKTMEGMAGLLSEGGHCIYVAPSGGRDRRDASGAVAVAPFDPQSVEMFYLMAQRASRPTHFYPMALSTYDILPPPETVQVELGEQRRMTYSPIHLGIGPELDMAAFDGVDRQERRAARADAAWRAVCEAYARFPQ